MNAKKDLWKIVFGRKRIEFAFEDLFAAQIFFRSDFIDHFFYHSFLFTQLE